MRNNNLRCNIGIVQRHTPMRQRDNIRRAQNVLLIWLDSNADKENDDCRNNIVQLKRVVNDVNIFTDDQQCVTFLTENNNDKVCMIISGSLGPHIMPIIHDMSQVDSIFIFCDNKPHHEKWANKWPKIKGVFTEINSICGALKQAAHECEHNSVGISFMPTRGADAFKENSNQLHCSFMYTQILKEIILTIKFEDQHIKEFIDYCREVFADNIHQLKNIEQLKRNYHDKTPIWWYTYDCLLYPMLNRALRTMDMNIAIKMGFFIGDLHRQLQQVHSEQFGDRRPGQALKVYRGQGLSTADFEQMMNTKGGLIAFNSFLSTSTDRDVSLMFAESNQSNPDLVGVLFVVTIDPSISSPPFASINDISYYQKQEQEVLFSMHTVFRIQEIKQMHGNNRLWQVELILTSENDQQLQALTKSMQEKTAGSSGWFRLGRLLTTMGQPEQAQKMFELLLEQSSNESDKANVLHQLGWVIDDQGEYKEALSFYTKSLDIRQKILPPHHPDLADSYNCIGLVYDSMGEYTKGLSFHEKALEIRQKSLPPNHPDLAKSYNNIGLVYDNMGEYSKALSSYEKALEIRQESLPSHHPDLAMSYSNIGLLYDTMREYSKALSSHEKALEIRQKSLPSNHPDLASSYNNIGMVYNNMSEYSKALSYYEKDLEISQKTLPSNHPDLAKSYGNNGLVYYNMGEYSKALLSHEKALEIWQKSLPPNHPDLASAYDNIGVVYENMGEFSKASSFFERAVDIGQLSVPSNHPNLKKWRNNLELVKKKL